MDKYNGIKDYFVSNKFITKGEDGTSILTLEGALFLSFVVISLGFKFIDFIDDLFKSFDANK